MNTEATIAKMQSDIEHLATSFDEFKDDTKKFHERIDDLARDIHKVGGLIQALASVQEQVNENAKWINENKDLIISIKKERASNRQRIYDMAFKVISIIVMAALFVYIGSVKSEDNLKEEIIHEVVELTS